MVMKMRLYHVKADHWSFNQYDAFLVWARTPKQAERIAKKHGDRESFRDEQIWTATELCEPSEPGIALGSYNGA